MTISGGRDFSSGMKSLFFHDSEGGVSVTGYGFGKGGRMLASHRNSQCRKAGVEEEFAVAFHAEEGAFDDIRREPVRFQGCADTVAGLCVQGGIANDAAGSHVLA